MSGSLILVCKQTCNLFQNIYVNEVIARKLTNLSRLLHILNVDYFSLRPEHRSALAPLDSGDEDCVSPDASFRSGFESANTSLVSGVRIAEADTSAISDVSDADYESAAEATDHDVSFDGE